MLPPSTSSPPPILTLVTRQGGFSKKRLKHLGEQLGASEILGPSGRQGLRFQPGFGAFLC